MRRDLWSSESGVALIAVLLAMALLTAIGAALTAVGIVEFRTSMNHRSATRALLLADAGATHALALLRGPLNSYEYGELLIGADGVGGTEDDGVLSGFGLASVDVLADSGLPLGKGRYFVELINDPGDPSGDPYIDSNERFIAVCRGVTPDGGRAEVHVLLAAPSFPAVASNGPLTVVGNPEVLGPCAGVHANGPLTIEDHPTVDGDVTGSDTIINNGTVYDADGDPVEPRQEQPIEVPELNPLDYCGEAEYLLKNGTLVTVGPPRDSTSLSGPKVLGWQWDPAENTYTLSGNDAVPGTVCADGNIWVNGNLGAENDPLKISLLATGSVWVGGTPVVEPDHSEGVLIVSGGDVQIGGTAKGYDPYYSGLIYARSQCQVNGTPILDGHLLCYDAPDDPGTANYVNENKINGTPKITYDCTGMSRLTFVSAWWESRAQ